MTPQGWPAKSTKASGSGSEGWPQAPLEKIPYLTNRISHLVWCWRHVVQPVATPRRVHVVAVATGMQLAARSQP